MQLLQLLIAAGSPRSHEDLFKDVTLTVSFHVAVCYHCTNAAYRVRESNPCYYPGMNGRLWLAYPLLQQHTYGYIRCTSEL